jgi:hypothetical protein
MTDKRSLKDLFRMIFWIVAISILFGLGLTVFFVVKYDKIKTIIPQTQDTLIIETDTTKTIDTVYIPSNIDTLIIIKE